MLIVINYGVMQCVCIVMLAFVYVWVQLVHVEEYKDQLQFHL